jgi:hypothetical protein
LRRGYRCKESERQTKSYENDGSYGCHRAASSMHMFKRALYRRMPVQPALRHFENTNRKKLRGHSCALDHFLDDANLSVMLVILLEFVRIRSQAVIQMWPDVVAPTCGCGCRVNGGEGVPWLWNGSSGSEILILLE